MGKRLQHGTCVLFVHDEDRLAAGQDLYAPIDENKECVAIVHSAMRRCFSVLKGSAALDAVFMSAPRQMREEWLRTKARELGMS